MKEELELLIILILIFGLIHLTANILEYIVNRNIYNLIAGTLGIITAMFVLFFTTIIITYSIKIYYQKKEKNMRKKIP